MFNYSDCMGKTLVDSVWAMDLPRHWLAQKEEGMVACFAEDGVGVLQIRTATKSSDITTQELFELAEPHLKAGAQAIPAKFGPFRGIQYNLCVDGRYWAYYYVTLRGYCLFITYNCSARDLSVEIHDVERILKSLRIHEEMAQA